MENLLEIYQNITSFLPDNRIDGSFIGDKNLLLKKYIFDSKHDCKIFIIGEISISNDFIYEYKEPWNKNKYFCKITDDNKYLLLDILQKSYLEVLYIFNDENKPMVMIDDFPEDITIAI